MQPLRHILVATDFGPSTAIVLDTAIALAALGRARVTVVHVCELTTAPSGAGTMRDEDVIARCRAKLDALLDQRRGRGVELAALMRTGRAVEKINNAAAEVGASMIVMGRSGAERAGELGSVTDLVLRAASRPVLVVRGKELV